MQRAIESKYVASVDRVSTFRLYQFNYILNLAGGDFIAVFIAMSITIGH